MCKACSKSWDRARRNDDGSVYGTMVWAAKRARAAAAKHAKVLAKMRLLERALEAGSYNTNPSTLIGGSALKMEDLSATMKMVTFDSKKLKLVKKLKKARKK